MDDLEHTLGKILQDPEAMAGILSLAQNLGLGPPQELPSTDGDNQAGASVPPSDGFPATVTSLLAEAGRLNGKQAALLNALRPFIREGRREKIDRAIQAARISHIAGSALRTLGQNEQGR